MQGTRGNCHWVCFSGKQDEYELVKLPETDTVDNLFVLMSSDLRLTSSLLRGIGWCPGELPEEEIEAGNPVVRKNFAEALVRDCTEIADNGSRDPQRFALAKKMLEAVFYAVRTIKAVYMLASQSSPV